MESEPSLSLYFVSMEIKWSGKLVPIIKDLFKNIWKSNK